jgi:1-acyl-sn-glycerol-3-phosphate acyltransferase
MIWQRAVALVRALFQYPLFYFGLLLLGCMCLGWCFYAWVKRPFLSPEEGRVLGRAGISKGFAIYFDISGKLGLTRFELGELDALNAQPSMILAANHPTFLDAVFLISRLQNVGCIMKANVVDNPFLGAGARLAQYIRNDNVANMFRLSVQDLQRGSHLLVFPEGTRTVQRPVNDFKWGFAHIAHQAGVPIQTIFIENDSAFLTKGWPIHHKPPKFPMVYRVRLGRRLHATGETRQFARELQHYFERELAKAELTLHSCPPPLEQPVHD